jgi:uncharacterized protein YjbI with pentapeptide repeats
LQPATRTGTDRSRARFRASDLSFARCRATNFTEDDLGAAQLNGAALAGAILARANLRDADLTGADLTRVDLAERSWLELTSAERS